MTLNDPYQSFKVTPFFDGEYLINGNTNRDLYNSVISNDLEWLSKICNDTKRRPVSLQQLSFLLKLQTIKSSIKTHK